MNPYSIKRDTGANGNLMSFSILKSLFPKLRSYALQKNNNVALKTYTI